MQNNSQQIVMLFATIALGCHMAYAENSLRLWTDQQGRQVEARLVSFDSESGRVMLARSDGREISLLKTQLHATDQEYLAAIPAEDASSIEGDFGASVSSDSSVVKSRSGPFGLWMGMSLDDIGAKAEPLRKPGWYKLESVPNPHHAFESYIIQVGPQNGLSWIKAIGRNISTSSFGSEIQSAFEDMRQKLEKQYGVHKINDFLQRGSIWNEGRDWMMSIIKNERVFSASWEGGPRTRLPNNLKSIYLGVSGVSNNQGYIIIEYSFMNEDVVEKELAALSDGAL